MKIGFIDRRGNNNYIASCSCGTVKLIGQKSYYSIKVYTPTCDKCGNKNFAHIYNASNKRKVYPYLETLDTGKHGFKLKRTNISVSRDDDYNVVIKKNMVKILKYDFKNKNISVYVNGVDQLVSKNYKHSKSYLNFFNGIAESKIRESIMCEEMKELYDFTWDSLGYKNNGYDRKFHIGLIELLDCTHIEILHNAGFKALNRFGNKSHWNRVPDAKATKPHKILGLPRFALKYIKEDESFSSYIISELRKAIDKIDGNRFKELLEIAYDEGNVRDLCQVMDRMLELQESYGYSNMKKLFLYLIRDTRMNQGITSATDSANLLRDYVRMSTDLGVEYEKYSKSLKKDHDIVAMNYASQKNKIERLKFKEIVENEDYKGLEYKAGKYVIIAPTESDDLVREGSQLSHCIASYVKDVVSKRCKIFFLRKEDEVESPLISIEVRNDNVRQVRGRSNRSATLEEKDIISEWAKKKELNENYY